MRKGNKKKDETVKSLVDLFHKHTQLVKLDEYLEKCSEIMRTSTFYTELEIQEFVLKCRTTSNYESHGKYFREILNNLQW